MNPEIPAAVAYGIAHARDYLSGKKILAITGAGISTDSGIPDYRGAGRIAKHPMTFDDFMGSPVAQARYWARSYAGWSRISQAQPNRGHQAVASAQQSGKIGQLITQNVDGLHQAAGSLNVIELHGRLDRVLCTQCGLIVSRQHMDSLIFKLNPTLARDAEVDYSPDGDAEVEVPQNFRVPSCAGCGGSYKPDVIFFGESVPANRVEASERALAESEAVLVAGTSLSVNSGLRLVKLAARRSLPVVIVNLGDTKADHLSAVKINAGTSHTLEQLFL